MKLGVFGRGRLGTAIAQAAQEGLASLPGKEVDAAIMTMLADGAGAHRIIAMDLIVRRRMTSAVPALLDAAGGSDSKLRIAAVQKLGELAGPADLPPLLWHGLRVGRLRLFRHTNGSVRAA